MVVLIHGSGCCYIFTVSGDSGSNGTGSTAGWLGALPGMERVDVAEIHDAFAPFELISLEDVGLFPAGKAGPATLDGETAPVLFAPFATRHMHEFGTTREQFAAIVCVVADAPLSPSAYRRGGAGLHVRYTIVDSTLA